MRKLKIYEMQRLSIEAYQYSTKIPLVLILDNIRSMHNVGSILRTADAFRLESVFLCGITACPPHPDIHKTALGAEESVQWQYAPDAAMIVKALKRTGYRICALEQAEGSKMLQDFHALTSERYALLLGNEVNGLAQSLIDLSDCCLEIPQYGTKHSLNVSVATGIAIWQIATPLIPLMEH